MKTILITGGSGFIGKAVCRTFFSKYRVIALDRVSFPDKEKNYISIQVDLEDEKAVSQICAAYQPDIVIHCAGIARQSLRFKKKDMDLYDRMNRLVTETLAHSAIASNPELYFIFLSSVSVYGENRNKKMISETDTCMPTSLYAKSKLNAENKLTGLYHQAILKKVDIFRLAPVYDGNQAINLEKRVFAPKKICYLRFGSGNQKMSALARDNLLEFIEFRLAHMGQDRFCNIFNVCDERPYSFNELIEIFKKTRHQPSRKLIKIPLCMIDAPARVIGSLHKDYSAWIYSVYNKLAKDLIFDNKRMFDTGFKPRLNLKSVFMGKGE